MNYEERYEQLLTQLQTGADLLNEYKKIEPLADTPEKKLLYDTYLFLATPLAVSDVITIIIKNNEWEQIEKGFALDFNNQQMQPWAINLLEVFKNNRTKVIAILERFSKIGDNTLLNDIIIDIANDLNKAQYRLDNLAKFLKRA